jgi:hypothetical protein
MPLASWYSLHFYGEAAAAAVLQATASAAPTLSARARAGATTSGGAAITLAKPTRLVNRPATLTGVAAVTQALPKARARPTATIRVNTLGQDDVTGAVLEAFVEPGVTLKQAMRLVLAAQTGKVSVAGSTVAIRNVNDTKTRITATTDTNGQRTAVTVDASDG